MLWLNSPNRVTGERQGRCLLSAVLKIGWRIVESTPEERALLEAHGLASGVPTAPEVTCIKTPGRSGVLDSYHCRGAKRSAAMRIPSSAGRRHATYSLSSCWTISGAAMASVTRR
jgi:hypothetical protein